MTAPGPEPAPGPGPDPVAARRARIATWCDRGKRVGYGLYAVAVVAFFVGLATTYSEWLVGVIVAAMAVGAVMLIPAIIFGYGVKAAEREERGEPFRY